MAETLTLDDIKPALRTFLREDAGVWVSDGGDGALHWMLRMGREVLDEPEFAGRERGLPIALPTNGGTIDFVAKTAGIKGNAEQLVAILREALSGAGSLETVELDTLDVSGVCVTPEGDVPLRTLGFAAAAGGVGQRFFARYYESDDPRPSDIVRVVGRTLASTPVAFTPLRHVPGIPNGLRSYARELFRPTHAELTVDGERYPEVQCTGIHIASIPINLGNVMRFFTGAKAPGQLHAIYGAPKPLDIIRNLPRMYAGRSIRGGSVVDGPCSTMTVRALGDELLSPVIDGEYYEGVREISFRLGPRIRLAKLSA